MRGADLEGSEEAGDDGVLLLVEGVVDHPAATDGHGGGKDLWGRAGLYGEEGGRGVLRTPSQRGGGRCPGPPLRPPPLFAIG